MPKSETFFVIRNRRGELGAQVTLGKGDSCLALDIAIVELDPFQRASQLEWQSARTFLSLDSVAS